MSKESCSLSVPSVFTGLGLSWSRYVFIVGFEDVEESVDICLSCSIFDFLFILLVDTYLVEVFIHRFFVDSFGVYYEI